MIAVAPAYDVSKAIRVRRAIIGRMSLSLLPNRRIESTQALQVSNDVIEIALAQAIDAEGRHRRFRIADDRLHLVLLVSLDPLARIHDLDREHVLVFLDALDRLTALRRDRDRFESRARLLDRAADPPHHHV